MQPKQIEVTFNTVFAKNEEDFLSTEVDGEMVIMNAHTGQYFGLNEVSTRIWQIIEGKSNLQDIIDILLKEYDVDKKQCEEETSKLVARMCQLRMLKIIDS